MRITKPRIRQIIREELNRIYETAPADPIPVDYTDQPPPEPTGIDAPEHQELIKRAAQTNVDAMWPELSAFTPSGTAKIVHTLDLLEQWPADEAGQVWEKMKSLYAAKVTKHNSEAGIMGTLASRSTLTDALEWVGSGHLVPRFEALGTTPTGGTAGMEAPGSTAETPAQKSARIERENQERHEQLRWLRMMGSQ